jgi:phosphoenolpyruvate carboxylase
LQECAALVAEDEAAITAILAFVDISVVQVQKSATSSTARTLTAATNTLFNVSRVPSCRALIVDCQVPKGGKDIFNVLQQAIETLKAASTNTPQYELLMTSMKIMVEVTSGEATRKKLVKKRKWVEKLLASLKDVGEKGKRRGAAVDKEKEEVLGTLRGWLLVEKA